MNASAAEMLRHRALFLAHDVNVSVDTRQVWHIVFERHEFADGNEIKLVIEFKLIGDGNPVDRFVSIRKFPHPPENAGMSFDGEVFRTEFCDFCESSAVLQDDREKEPFCIQVRRKT